MHTVGWGGAPGGPEIETVFGCFLKRFQCKFGHLGGRVFLGGCFCAKPVHLLSVQCCIDHVVHLRKSNWSTRPLSGMTCSAHTPATENPCELVTSLNVRGASWGLLRLRLNQHVSSIHGPPHTHYTRHAQHETPTRQVLVPDQRAILSRSAREVI